MSVKLKLMMAAALLCGNAALLLYFAQIVRLGYDGNFYASNLNEYTQLLSTATDQEALAHTKRFRDHPIGCPFDDIPPIKINDVQKPRVR